MPVFNKRAYLETCLGSVLAAEERDAGVEVIVVDNGSTDGSLELVRALCAGRARVETHAGGTIAAVRNAGARVASAPIFCFLDCDVVVPEDYFARLRAVFERKDVAAAGCRVDYPTDGPWVEAVWHRMHRTRVEGFQHYINSANFSVRRDAFTAVGGFNEALTTGEDAELGMRLNQAGHRIWETQSLVVVHVDNPRTLSAFLRKEIWHGLGMFGTMRLSLLDRPTIMMFVHLILMVAAGVQLGAGRGGIAARLAVALLLVTAVPAVTVLYRMRSGARGVPFLPAVALYEVYYLARLIALARIARGSMSRRPA